MARFNLGVPSLGEGDSMLDLYKTAVLAEQKEKERQVNTAKATVSSLISSYNTAKSQPLQQEIINTMKSYYGALPPVLRASVEPYIAHGPTSPAAEKRREFLKFNPPPKQPVLNEAPGAEASNRYQQAEYLFRAADHKRALTSFTYDSASAGDKQNFIPFEDGSGAIRNADGQVMLMSQQDLGFKELEEKYGITTREIILNPNGIPTGKMGFMTMNGRKIETEETIRPFEPDPNKRLGQRIINITDMPKSDWEITHPTSVHKLLMDWKNPSTDDETVEDWKERALKEPKKVAEEMGQVWAQYTFRIVDIKKEGWLKKILNILPFVSSNDSSTIIPIRGRPVPIKDQSGKEYIFYYDSNIDLVSNGFGEPLGSYDQVVQMLSDKQITTGGTK